MPTQYDEMSTLRLRHKLATMGLPYHATRRSFRTVLIAALTHPRYLQMWISHYSSTRKE
jgi:hypothetical protein